MEVPHRSIALRQCRHSNGDKYMLDFFVRIEHLKEESALLF